MCGCALAARLRERAEEVLLALHLVAHVGDEDPHRRRADLRQRRRERSASQPIEARHVEAVADHRHAVLRHALALDDEVLHRLAVRHDHVGRVRRGGEREVAHLAVPVHEVEPAHDDGHARELGRGDSEQRRVEVLRVHHVDALPAEAPDLLARAMLRVLVDPERARRMGEAARRFVESELTLERMIERHDRFYRQVARGARGAEAAA